MTPPGPLTEQDPASKDKQNERVLKKRKSEEEDLADDPAVGAGGYYWANMRRLLQHNNSKLEQSLDLELATLRQMTQTSMMELGS